MQNTLGKLFGTLLTFYDISNLSLNYDGREKIGYLTLTDWNFEIILLDAEVKRQ